MREQIKLELAKIKEEFDTLVSNHEKTRILLVQTEQRLTYLQGQHVALTKLLGGVTDESLVK